MGGRQGAENQLFVDGSFGSALSDARPFSDVRRPHKSMVLRTCLPSASRTRYLYALPDIYSLIRCPTSLAKADSHALEVRAAKRVNNRDVSASVRL